MRGVVWFGMVWYGVGGKGYGTLEISFCVGNGWVVLFLAEGMRGCRVVGMSL